MRVVDPGHKYLLDAIDGGPQQELQFVKRNDPPERYPGNVDCYPGTTMQEVLRALINRAGYVNSQKRCAETTMVEQLFKQALMLLEIRAKRERGEYLPALELDTVHLESTCPVCGHIRCAHHVEAWPRWLQ